MTFSLVTNIPPPYYPCDNILVGVPLQLFVCSRGTKMNFGEIPCHCRSLEENSYLIYELPQRGVMTKYDNEGFWCHMG